MLHLRCLSAVVCLSLSAVAASADDAAKARYDAAADYSAKLGGRALLVVVDGKTVYERYDHDWKAETPHPLASGTKSFSGVLAAAAIQDKIIPGWDAVVSDTIDAWESDPLKKQITLRQLLSLASGLDANDPSLESRGAGPLGANAKKRSDKIAATGVPQAADKHAAALSAKMTGVPGKQFEYGPTHFYAFGAYLEARLKVAGSPHQTVEQYFVARIAGPIGLKIGRWGRDAKGHVNLPGGMMLTASEWAKLGELVRLEGKYKSADGTMRQLIDPALLAECFKPSSTNPHYGLTWWLPSDDAAMADADAGGKINAGDPPRQRRQSEQMSAIRDPEGKPVKVYMAAGLGKQRLIVLPEHDVVIVRFAEATREGVVYSDGKLIALAMGWQN